MKFLSNLFGNKNTPVNKTPVNNRPVNNPSNPPVPPSYMKNAEDLKLFQKRLNSLGDPRSQDVEAYAKKLIVYELYQITGERLRPDELDVNAELMPVFDLDELDMVGFSMTFDEMYGEEISFPDWQAEDIPHLTSRDFIEAVKRHFNN